MRILYVSLAVAGMFVLSYLTIGQEMNTVVLALGMILIFLICFFSVKISLAVLIFSMLLSPEIAIGETLHRTITARFEDILLITMTISWMIRMAIFKDIGFMLKTRLNWPMIVYSAIAIISTTMGALRGNVNPASGFFFTLKIIEYFFIFNVVVNYVQSEKDVENLLNMLLIVCGIICIYSLILVVSGGKIEAPFEGTHGSTGSGERNTLSGYLVLMGSVAAGVMIYTKTKIERSLLALMIGLIVFILLFSISRSGWIAAIVSIMVLFVCSKQKNIYFLTLSVLIFTLPFFIPHVAQERLIYTFHEHSSMQQFEIFGLRLDASSSGRIFSALMVFKKFMEHPFLGFGMTGFSFVDGQFIRTLIELGVLGLATYIWLLTSVHQAILMTIKQDIAYPRIKGMAIGFYAGFWGLIVHAFTANTFIIVRISEPFWCLAGLTVIMLSISKSGVETQHKLSVA